MERETNKMRDETIPIVKGKKGHKNKHAIKQKA